MIRRLAIRGLGVIEEAHIPLGAGLTVVTGETGAGKTMILSGLGLLGGSRSDFQTVRHGSGAAEVEGTWFLGHENDELVERVSAILAEAGGYLDSGPHGVELVLARILEDHGRSRAVAGGRTVPAALLQELSSLLVAVHGQSDQVRLRQPSAHRRLVDRFAGPAHQELLSTYQAAFEEWRDSAGELRALMERRQATTDESERLAFGISEIEEVDPQAGEDEELDLLAARLSHAGSLFEDAREARTSLIGSDVIGGDSEDSLAAEAAGGSGRNVMSSLDQAIKALDRIVAVDPSLADVGARLREIAAMAADAAGDLAAYAESLNADPAQQHAAEQRRGALRALSRRYGGSVAATLEWLASARAAVTAAEGFDDRVEQLRTQVTAAHARARELATRLTAGREAAARRLEHAVSAELTALAMPDARIEVRVAADDSGRLGQGGADSVEFLLVPHAGAPARPLSRGASGGELSRVMLALEVVLAGSDPVPTFIFDEVDAGIGGRAAVEVGRRLARLSRTAQVILVTHLPQVAAFGDQHVLIEKSGDGEVTASSVRVLEGPDRVRELARMLSGLASSETGLAHAEELLQLADAERSVVS